VSNVSPPVLTEAVSQQATEQHRQLRTDTLSSRFASLFVRQGDINKPRLRHAIAVLLEHGHLLFRERRLWGSIDEDAPPL